MCPLITINLARLMASMYDNYGWSADPFSDGCSVFGGDSVGVEVGIDDGPQVIKLVSPVTQYYKTY